MQRIAVPMIGGMISSTLLTLIVIPAIFGLVKGVKLAFWPGILPCQGRFRGLLNEFVVPGR